LNKEHCFFVEKGPAAEAKDTPQSQGLLCNPCDEDEEKDDQVFSFFQVMEDRWNEMDGENRSTRGKNLSQCHLVHHKSHMGYPGIETGPPRWEAGD
jgi:hypothetical protein